MNEQRIKKEKGQSLVEFALLLPILLIILIGVVDLGRMYYAYVVITDAAAEGPCEDAVRRSAFVACVPGLRTYWLRTRRLWNVAKNATTAGHRWLQHFLQKKKSSGLPKRKQEP